MAILKTVLAFIIAVAVTEVLAAISHTQFVIAELTALGVDIPFGERLSMTLHDIVGLAPLFGGLIALALLIAFIAAHFVQKLAPGLRWLVFTVAGAVAVVALLQIMTAFFSIHPIAGARSTAGLLFQALAGAIGGFVFASLTRKRA